MMDEESKKTKVETRRKVKVKRRKAKDKSE